MNDHIEDIQKLDEILKLESECNTFEEEIQDCLNYNISDEEELDEYDSDSSFDLDISEDALVLAENRNFNIETINFSGDLSSIKHYLTPEEARAINSCKDSKLKRLLLLNRAKNIHLKATQRKLYANLRECVDAMLKTRNKKIKLKYDRSKFFGSRCGFPFFRAKDCFTCPVNADVIRKRNRKEVCLDYLPVVKVWTLEDRIRLRRSICFNYTNERIKEYEKQLDSLYRLKVDSKDPQELVKITADIQKCEEYIKKWGQSETQDVPPLGYDSFDWNSIAEIELKGRHTASACKGMWTMVLHPSINTSEWSDEENESILQLAKLYSNQKWDKIASDLHTNRTAFTIFLHFFSTLNSKYSDEKFTPEEDQYLQELVDLCRVGNYIPWTKVAQHFDKRSRNQLYSRYNCHLNISFQKKGTFSEEEDVLLLILMRRFGTKFAQICDYLPCRSRLQIRNRCRNNLLYEELKQGAWTEEDDLFIVRHVDENGPKDWSKLITKMPLRNTGQIRHRYRFMQMWLSKNPDKKLPDVPRKAGYTKYDSDLQLLKKFADMFDDDADIPTLDDVRLKLKMCGYKRLHRIASQYVNTAVDEELIQYFQSSHKLRTAKVITKSDFETATKTVKSLLALLKVTLSVPSKETLNSNTALDNVDKEFLGHIFHNAYAHYQTLNEASTSKGKAAEKILKIDYKMNDCTISLIPPNVNTLIGMRSMLIKYSAFKMKINKTDSYSKAKDLINKKISSDLSQLPVAFRNLVTSERNDFKDRLKILFKWPAIMSILEPLQHLSILDVPRTIKNAAKQSVGTRGRPKKDYSRIALMNKSRLEKRMIAKATENVEEIRKHTKEGGDVDSLVDKLKKVNPNAKIKVVAKSKNIEFVDVNPCKKIKLLKEEEDIESGENDIGDLEEDIKKLDGILGSESLE